MTTCRSSAANTSPIDSTNSTSFNKLLLPISVRIALVELAVAFPSTADRRATQAGSVPLERKVMFVAVLYHVAREGAR